MHLEYIDKNAHRQSKNMQRSINVEFSGGIAGNSSNHTTDVRNKDGQGNNGTTEDADG